MLNKDLSVMEGAFTHFGNIGEKDTWWAKRKLEAVALEEKYYINPLKVIC